MLLNSKNFNQVNFFLGGRKEVNSLEEGAKKYGGATLLGGKIYSNIENGDYINLLKGENSISIIIPSTLDADVVIDNTEYVAKYLKILNKEYSGKITVCNSEGSWYSDDLNKVIIEKNTIITVSDDLTAEKINAILNLGILIKDDMRQEAVSVLINDALCIV